MTPYRLDQVLGSMLIALAEAQHMSDMYSDWLRASYSDPTNKMSVLQVPNAQLQQATINLQMAVAAVVTPDESAAAEPVKPKEQMWVYVDASDLATLPANTISTLTLTVPIRDAEIVELPANPSPPAGSDRGQR